MLPYIIGYIALCLVGFGVPASFAICLAIAHKHGSISGKALQLCCLVLGLLITTLALFTYWTLRAPFEQSESILMEMEITLIMLLFTGVAAAMLAYLPLPRVIRHHTLPVAFCIVAIIPFLLPIALFAYLQEHPSSSSDGTEIGQGHGE